MRSRYYNPNWQRFISSDILIEGNLFCYCSNNPCRNKDQSGMFGENIYQIKKQKAAWNKAVSDYINSVQNEYYKAAIVQFGFVGFDINSVQFTRRKCTINGAEAFLWDAADFLGIESTSVADGCMALLQSIFPSYDMSIVSPIVDSFLNIANTYESIASRPRTHECYYNELKFVYHVQKMTNLSNPQQKIKYNPIIMVTYSHYGCESVQCNAFDGIHLTLTTISINGIFSKEFVIQ